MAVRAALAHDSDLAWVLAGIELERDPVIVLEPHERPPPREPVVCEVAPILGAKVARAPQRGRRRLKRRVRRPAEIQRVQLRRMGYTKNTYVVGELVAPLSEAERQVLEELPRPTNRTECRPGSPGRWWGDQPCPYRSCTYNLGIDVSDAGSIWVIEGLRDGRGSCALDLADEGSRTLEEVAAVDGCTRERVRQIEVKSLHQLGVKLDRR